MFLCDEYASRCNLQLPKIKHVKKGFAFTKQNYLLVIKWLQDGPGPGFYEISECLLEKRIKTHKINNIMWEEYPGFISHWSSCNSILINKNDIFFLIWEYFIRKNENIFLENYNHNSIFRTINKENPDRVVDCMYFLDEISKKHKSIYDFWNQKLSEVITLYCYWLSDV